MLDISAAPLQRLICAVAITETRCVTARARQVPSRTLRVMTIALPRGAIPLAYPRLLMRNQILGGGRSRDVGILKSAGLLSGTPPAVIPLPAPPGPRPRALSGREYARIRWAARVPELRVREK